MIKNMKIETDRLIIRPYIEDDFRESFELMQNKELFQFMHMDVMSLVEYRRLFDWLIQSYDVGFNDNFKYSFGIFLKRSGHFIGWIGVGGLEFQPEDKEIFYLIGRDYWGDGYASEAVSSFLSFCFNEMNLQRVVAKVDPRNLASKRVIEKSGLMFEYVLADLPEGFSECNGEFLYSLTDQKYRSSESKLEEDEDIS